MRRILIAAVLAGAACIVVDAQIVVTDPAVTLRNAVTATLNEYIVNIQQDQRRQVRRMSRRLSLFTNLDKYSLPEPPQ